MNPRDNVDLSKALSARVKGLPEEAGLRCSCGRAYYGAFGYARDALMSAKLKMFGDGQDHKRVSSLLKQSTDPGVKTAGGLLDQLRKTRNSADYDVGAVPLRAGPFNPVRAGTAVVLATTVVGEIDRILKTDKRLAIPTSVT